MSNSSVRNAGGRSAKHENKKQKLVGSVHLNVNDFSNNNKIYLLNLLFATSQHNCCKYVKVTSPLPLLLRTLKALGQSPPGTSYSRIITMYLPWNVNIVWNRTDISIRQQTKLKWNVYYIGTDVQPKCEEFNLLKSTQCRIETALSSFRSMCIVWIFISDASKNPHNNWFRERNGDDRRERRFNKVQIFVFFFAVRLRPYIISAIICGRS